MIDKEKYFDLLFQCLDDNKLLPTTEQNQWRVDFQSYFEMVGIDKNIILEMKAQYDVGFENVFLMNCKKCALLCDNFGIKHNKLLIQTSVYFTVLGCLLDWLIDYGNIKQRQEAEYKLRWGYCGDYFCKNIGAKEDSAIDLLYEKVSTGMGEISHCNSERFEVILEMVKQAIDSELQVNSTNQNLFNEDIVLNKSVLFVQIGAEILLAEKEDMISNDRKLIKELGYAFALIDDLCDLYEDMETGQSNLLMNRGINIDMETVIKSTICELNKKLRTLEARFSGQLYEFILQEIREWGMSSTELRKRIWCING